jgi:AraC-like DNA-binding protein
MKHQYQQPHPLLAEYIRTVLIVEGSAEPNPNDLPLVTNGMPALLCVTEKDKTENEKITHLALFGRSIPDEFWTITPATTAIAYFFRPFTLAAIFNIAANKLNEKPIELNGWHPQKTNALLTQLMYAKPTFQKIKVLENFLLHQLELNRKEAEIIQFATDQIMYNPGTEILGEMIKKLHLTERTFQRIFKKYVGITANQYRRICQFQVSFSQLRSKGFDKLTDVAFDNGFSDQSHFIRSFKEFTKITPNDYLKSGLKGGGIDDDR